MKTKKFRSPQLCEKKYLRTREPCPTATFNATAGGFARTKYQIKQKKLRVLLTKQCTPNYK
jgi:hypothetical protein